MATPGWSGVGTTRGSDFKQEKHATFGARYSPHAPLKIDGWKIYLPKCSS